MSYALETKKRKFDRILESLTERKTDAPPNASRTSLNSRNNTSLSANFSKETLQAASKRRRVTPTLSSSTTHSSLIGHYLPSSRTAFLERLETFRHITKWHIPSTSRINAAEWAKRGWTCADVDTVACHLCSERVRIDLNVDTRRVVHEESEVTQEYESEAKPDIQDEADGDMSQDLQEALTNKYREMIVTSHAEGCSWRKRGCDSSIQRIEKLLNVTHVVDTVRARCKSIEDKVDAVPTVTELPNDEERQHIRDPGVLVLDSDVVDTNVLRLAICGWQYKEADVVECKHCFRSLGLWLYRGPDPTVENLDALDSHLEYCPWRSPEAQDTELTLHTKAERASTKIERFSGWLLTYNALEKHTVKKTGKDTASTSTLALSDGAEPSREMRDQKMKDLVRRIKAIKKPFNMKGLLKKQDRSDA